MIQPFDITRTGMPLFDNMLEHPKYFRENKGMTFKIVYVTPDEYMEMVAKGHRIPLREEYDAVDDDLVNKYANDMKHGDKFPMPMVEYREVFGHPEPHRVSFSQEGRHRAMAAKIIGVEKIPVLIVYPVDIKEFEMVKTKMEVLPNPIQRNPVAWHHTSRTFDAFDLDKTEFGLHVGTQAQAWDVVQWTGGTKTITAYEIDFEPRKMLRMRDKGTWNPYTVCHQLMKLREIFNEFADEEKRIIRHTDWRVCKFSVQTKWKEIWKTPCPQCYTLPELRKLLVRYGVDAIVYLNRFEPIGMLSRTLDYGERLSDDTIMKLSEGRAKDSYIILNLDIIRRQKKTVHTYDPDQNWDENMARMT